jgi:Flp pilus assembly protein TadG
VTSRRRQPVRWRCDRGAAAVEFALVVPVLLIVVFGIIDFGRMLNAQLQVSEAAREGARAASTITGTASQRSNAASDRIALFSSNTTGGVEFDSDASSFCGRTPGDGDINTVTASYRFGFITPVGDIGALFGGGRWGAPITIRATSVMPCRS